MEKKGTARAKGKKEADVPTVKKTAKTKEEAAPKKSKAAEAEAGTKKPRTAKTATEEKKPRATVKSKEVAPEAGPEIKAVPKRRSAPSERTPEPRTAKSEAPSFFSSSPKVKKEGESRGGAGKSDLRPRNDKGSFSGRDDRRRDERPREPRSDRPQGDRPFYKRDDRDRGDRPSGHGDRPARSGAPFKGPDKRRDDRPSRDKGPFTGNDKRRDDRAPYGKKPGSERRNDNPRHDRDNRPERNDGPNKGPFGYMEFGPKKSSRHKDSDRDNRPVRKDGPNKGPFGYMEFTPKGESQSSDRGRDNRSADKPGKDRPKAKDSSLIRLNRFISQAGVASRRDADELISSGRVAVNGKVVTELGSKAKRSDRITLDGKPLRTEKLVYILLNKPKGFITTTDDERGRRTVMELVEKAVPERIYPVGRLDRETLGLLLFTNDGELADRLTHPSHGARKVYHVFLDRPFVPEDFEKLLNGVKLEDGEFKPDGLQYVTASDGSEVGIELHSGRNRIVRRTFEHLGYEVMKLDRVVFAGITKKDLPRGRWRHLTERELGMLRMNR